MNNYVIDTNIVIKALEGNASILHLISGNNLFISFVTEIELLSWPSINASSKKAIEQFIAQCVIIEYSSYIKQLVIKYRRNFKLKLADAFIIATSVNLNYTLLTADKDFKSITGLSSVKIL